MGISRTHQLVGVDRLESVVSRLGETLWVYIQKEKVVKRYDGIWGIMREMSKGIKTGDCAMDSEPFELPGSSCKSWEEFNRLIEPMFAVNEKKPAVIWCVENGPFHKYIKKLRKQRRKNGCK